MNGYATYVLSYIICILVMTVLFRKSINMFLDKLETDELIVEDEPEEQSNNLPSRVDTRKKKKPKMPVLEKIDLKHILQPYVTRFSKTYFKGVNESMVVRHRQ